MKVTIERSVRDPFVGSPELTEEEQKQWRKEKDIWMKMIKLMEELGLYPTEGKWVEERPIDVWMLENDPEKVKENQWIMGEMSQTLEQMIEAPDTLKKSEDE